MVFFFENTRYCLRFGLIDNALLGLARPNQQKSPFHTKSLPRECFIYMLHSLGFLLFGSLFVPIQVAARLTLATSPVIYWIASLVTTPSQGKLVPITKLDDDIPPEKVERQRNLKSLIRTIILQETVTDELGSWTMLYFFVSVFLGTLLHVNHFSYLI